MEIIHRSSDHERFSAGPLKPIAHRAIPCRGVMLRSELTKRPVARVRVAAAYPPELVALDADGEALCAYVVGADGKVKSAAAIEATDERYAAAAARALVHWVYTPGELNGKPVATVLVIQFKFRCQPR